jgi:cysteinyl-tRNA synthetase
MQPGTTPRLFNSLGRQASAFNPRRPGRVGLYSCGMTVYADPHLGNMRPYVFSDTLRRLFEWKGLEVTQVVNITDVGHTVGESDLGEDKVEVAARAAESSVWDVTRHYTDVFFADIASLNTLPHTHNPRASDYVPQMIEFARELEAKGFAYRLESGLYFDTAKSPGYGRLALKPTQGAETEMTRLEAEPGKRASADFAVWRAERGPRRRLVHWDSPWGPGVPGWHLECSVMSIELLGAHFDVHTGGVDHREIHHVNEIAQSEAFLGDGADWVPLWMHNEFVLLDAQKIAKSSGRVPLLRDLTKAGNHPLAFRYFLLSAHYRSQLDLTDAGLHAAAAALRRLLGRVEALRPLPAVRTYPQAHAALTSTEGREALERFDQAMCDDLNTARLLAELNVALRTETIPEADKTVLAAAADWLTGLRLGELGPQEVTHADRSTLPAEHIEDLIAQRAAAREAGDWAEADRIRKQLGELGVQLKDTPQGTEWEPVAVEAREF